MSDLISRKAIYKAISDYLNRSRLGETSAQTDLRVGEIASIIHGVPTDFDKEKVIEELKEIKNHSEACRHQCEFASTEYFDYMGAEVAYKTAIAIVEKGGR